MNWWRNLSPRKQRAAIGLALLNLFLASGLVTASPLGALAAATPAFCLAALIIASERK